MLFFFFFFLFFFFPDQTRVLGNDEVCGNSDTLHSHLNTKSSVRVGDSKVELNPLAGFHLGDRDRWHQSDRRVNNIEPFSL